MMASIDASNIWGLLAGPIAVLVCYGPAIFMWLMREATSGKDIQRENDPHSPPGPG